MACTEGPASSAIDSSLDIFSIMPINRQKEVLHANKSNQPPITKVHHANSAGTIWHYKSLSLSQSLCTLVIGDLATVGDLQCIST